MSRHHKRPAKNAVTPKGKGHGGAGKLRIIGGEWRSRQLPVANVEGLRPTPNHIRETLYNWLTGWVAGAHCLDAFSGTGALGLEALSRGAAQVTFLEFSPVALRTLQDNLKTLRCTSGQAYQADTLAWLNQPAGQTIQKPFDLVFLDPPFHKGFAAPVCKLLQDQGWLAENALVYLETETTLGLPDVPASWRLWKEKTAGQVCSRLYQIN